MFLSVNKKVIKNKNHILFFPLNLFTTTNIIVISSDLSSLFTIEIEGKSIESTTAAEAKILYILQNAISRGRGITGDEIKQIIEES